MNIKEYQINAARTCADLGSKDNNLFHMEMGICTEKGELVDIYKKFFAYGKELDLVHLKEELGDICFYQANKDTFLGYFYSEDQINFEGLTQLEATTNFEEHKEGVFMLWVDPLETLDRASMWSLIYLTCRVYGIDFGDMLETNINKLKARYPEKFTQKNALNRDLNAEREVLENGN